MVLGLQKAWLYQIQQPQLQMLLPPLSHMVCCELWWQGAKNSAFTAFVRKAITLQTTTLRPDKPTFPARFGLQQCSLFWVF